MTITALYIGLNALLLLALSINVVRQRVRHRVAHGDGGVTEVQRAIRGQGNAAEYMPVALLIIAATEALGAPGFVVHGLGVLFTLGRLAHAATYALGAHFRFRQAGTAMTFTTLGLGGLGLVGWALMGGAA